MNCPRCRIRQLSPSLFCVDCGTRWTQKQLEYFDKRDTIFMLEYREAMDMATKNLDEKRRCLVKAILKEDSGNA